MNLNNSYDKPKISNLTKTLQQQTQSQSQIQKAQDLLPQDQSQLQPQHLHQSQEQQYVDSYSTFNSISNQSQFQDHMNIQSLPNQPPSYSQSTNKFNSFSNSHTNSLNYLPSTHNTPNIIGSSYSSNSSYKLNNFNPSYSFPTTNVNFDNIPQRNSYVHSQHVQPGLPPGFHQETQPQNIQGDNIQKQPFYPDQNFPTNPVHSQSYSQIPNETVPDHYMTYHEFFNNLASKSTNEDDNDDHLNIIDYPVNDLILMLSCLLTKIIEANDKLHPNHFDNTIALRQRLKSENNKRKEEAERENHDGITVDDDLDDDEMKNTYLANVLAFHGTNVPGISLHAYLSRVLKYCPVTNEVFLSLLVYFDRIAKKANNLQKEKEDQEQLFVMDSYNIHRLIISGITILSKFFSDIFYKNLRYAKVGGLPLEELNYLELQFLLLLDFKLMISVEDLQNYGDLLLRFWKREQITNQLIDNTAQISLTGASS